MISITLMFSKIKPILDNVFVAQNVKHCKTSIISMLQNALIFIYQVINKRMEKGLTCLLYIRQCNMSVNKTIGVIMKTILLSVVCVMFFCLNPLVKCQEPFKHSHQMKINLPFIENMGQAESDIHYFAKTFAGTVSGSMFSTCAAPSPRFY